MAQPTPYERLYNLTQYATDFPANPYNPAQHDAEFDAVEENLDGLNANLALLQRDDGALANLSVHPNALSSATRLLIASWNIRGNWTAFVDYAVKDFVVRNSLGYVAMIAHTSNDFTIDLAAGRWLQVDVNMAAFAASSGSSLVGWIRNAVNAVATTVAAWLGWQPPSAFDFMTAAQIADVQARTQLIDVSVPLQNFFNHVVQNQKRGIWPAGDYLCATPPTIGTGSANLYSGCTIQGEGMGQSTGGTRLVVSGTGFTGLLTVKKDAWRGLRLSDFGLYCAPGASTYGLLCEDSQISQPMFENIYVDGPTYAHGVLKGTGANGEFPQYINMRSGQNCSNFFYTNTGQAYYPTFLGGFAYMKAGGIVFNFDFSAGSNGGGLNCIGFSASPLAATVAGDVADNTLLKVRGSAQSTYKIVGGRFEHITRLYDRDSASNNGLVASVVSVDGAEFTVDNRKGHASNTLNGWISVSSAGTGAPDIVNLHDCRVAADGSGVYNDAVIDIVMGQFVRAKVTGRRNYFNGFAQPPYVSGSYNTMCSVDFDDTNYGNWSSNSGTVATANDRQSRSQPFSRFLNQTAFGYATVMKRELHSRHAMVANGQAINHLQVPQFRAAAGAVSNTAADAPWVHGGTTATFGLIWDWSARSGQPNPKSESPYSKQVQVKPTSYVYQDVTTIDLNVATISDGGVSGAFAVYQALVSAFGGAGAIRFTLENSSTGKIYDQIQMTGTSGGNSEQELITLRMLADLTATGSLRFKIENLGASNINLDFAWQFMSNDPNSVFSKCPSGGAVAGTTRWGAAVESIYAWSRLRLPYKSDTYGAAASPAHGDLESDLYLSSDTEMLTYYANSGWHHVPQSRVSSTAVGNVGGGEDDLQTQVVPAKTLFATGHAIVVDVYGTTANNSNPKTVKLYFGTVALVSQALTVSQVGKWHIRAEITRTGSSTQDYVYHLTQTGATVIHAVDVGTLTQTDTNALTVKCTGTVTDGGGGINNNDIVQEYMNVTIAN